MKVLALDTSTNACSVAIYNGTQAFAWFSIIGNQHAKVLLEKIDDLLQQANLKLNDLDLLAFGAGPGSFTGLRIGAGIIQGISVAYNIKVAPISSLKSLALHASKAYPQHYILPLLDARMGEVYLGLYGPDNTLIGEEMVINPAMINLADYAPLVIVGTGLLAYKELLSEKFPHAILASEIIYPHALEIAELAPLGTAVSGELALPQYIRNNVTDRN